MGTNYYASKPDCSHCGRGAGEIYIGKSSVGWVFALNTHPQENLCTLEDWIVYWLQEDVKIEDEYGKPLTVTEMLERILCRQGMAGRELLRSAVDGYHCLAHGAGTYDIQCGDFS